MWQTVVNLKPLYFWITFIKVARKNAGKAFVLAQELAHFIAGPAVGAVKAQA